MKTNFDESKSKIERLLDRTIEILERTHPEQTADAMSDYTRVLGLLSPVADDYQIKPITVLLKRLYVYPNRPEHNELLIEVHELKEMLHELRINESLTRKEASKIARKGLGSTVFSVKTWPWLLVAAVSIFIIMR